MPSCQLVAVRAKRICFNNLRASFDVRLMDPENRLGVRRIQLVDGPLLAHGIV